MSRKLIRKWDSEYKQRTTWNKKTQQKLFPRLLSKIHIRMKETSPLQHTFLIGTEVLSSCLKQHGCCGNSWFNLRLNKTRCGSEVLLKQWQEPQNTSTAGTMLTQSTMSLMYGPYVFSLMLDTNRMCLFHLVLFFGTL